MYRELKICFLNNRNVYYRFFRSGFSKRIYKYSIDYPPEKVALHAGQNVHTNDFRQNSEMGDQLILEWDNVPETQQAKDQRIIEYEKIHFLQVISQEPLLLAYNEQIPIKASENDCFHLYLHKRNGRISAKKMLSRAVFQPQSDGFIHCCHAFLRSGRLECWEERVRLGSAVLLQPTQLADAKFYASGVLHVDWLLEIDNGKTE